MEHREVVRIVRKKQIIFSLSFVALIAFIIFLEQINFPFLFLTEENASTIKFVTIVAWLLFARSYYRCPKCGARTAMKIGNVFPPYCHKCGVSFTNEP